MSSSLRSRRTSLAIWSSVADRRPEADLDRSVGLDAGEDQPRSEPSGVTIIESTRDRIVGVSLVTSDAADE